MYPFIHPSIQPSSKYHPLSEPGTIVGAQIPKDTTDLPWRREWLPTPVFLPGEFHGQKSLAGYSPWRRIGHGLATEHAHLIPGRLYFSLT